MKNNILIRNLMQAGYFLVILVVLIGIILFGQYGVSPRYPICGHVIISIAILGIGWLIISFTNRWMTKNIWKIVTFVLIYVLSIWAYSDSIINPNIEDNNTVIPNETAIVSEMNNTLSIFFPSRGAYEAEQSGNLLFHLVHLLSYLFFAMIVFSWFGKKMLNRSGYPLIKAKHKNIIWGYSDGGLMLAKDIMKNSSMQQVIFVLPSIMEDNEDEDKMIFNKIDSIGAMVIYKNFDTLFEDPTNVIAENKRFPNAHCHFFLTEDQDANTFRALCVSNSLKSKNKTSSNTEGQNANTSKASCDSDSSEPSKDLKSKNSPETSLYIRTEIPQSWTFFKDSPAEIHIFNQSDLTARKFAKDNPMIKCAIDDIKDLQIHHNFNILLLGFGHVGRELLHKEICDAQFVGSTFSATIFDNDLDVKNGDYQILYQECIDQYNLKFNPDIKQDLALYNNKNIVGSYPFYQWLQQNINRFDRIIVALGNDLQNVEVADTISRIEQYAITNNKNKKTIFAHVCQPEKYNCCKDESYPIVLFGDLNEIYTTDILINEQLDEMAKMVNYFYSLKEDNEVDKNKKKEIDEKEIKKISENQWKGKKNMNLFNKNSSRAAAANINNMIELAGGVTQLMAAIGNKEKLEILAETEHLRWNAFHFTYGIRKWNLDEIPDGHENAKLYVTDENSPLLKHACLVSFADLDVVTKKVNENLKKINESGNKDFKETDRRIVKHFPKIKEIAEQKIQ